MNTRKDGSQKDGAISDASLGWGWWGKLSGQALCLACVIPRQHKEKKKVLKMVNIFCHDRTDFTLTRTW
jgi:hypothetical protein